MSYEDNKKWRKKNPHLRKQENKRNYELGAKNTVNEGQEYTSKEIDLILEHSIPDRELAIKIGRSVKAIQIKRARLNLMA